MDLVPVESLDRNEPLPIEELLDLLASRPEWMADAACREHPELDWFPTRGDNVNAVRAVCAACLVRPECAEYGARERFGIWGGVSERGRRQRRRSDAA